MLPEGRGDPESGSGLLVLISMTSIALGALIAPLRDVIAAIRNLTLRKRKIPEMGKPESGDRIRSPCCRVVALNRARGSRGLVNNNKSWRFPAIVCADL